MIGNWISFASKYSYFLLFVKKFIGKFISGLNYEMTDNDAIEETEVILYRSD